MVQKYTRVVLKMLVFVDFCDIFSFLPYNECIFVPTTGRILLSRNASIDMAMLMRQCMNNVVFKSRWKMCPLFLLYLSVRGIKVIFILIYFF